MTSSITSIPFLGATYTKLPNNFHLTQPRPRFLLNLYLAHVRLEVPQIAMPAQLNNVPVIDPLAAPHKELRWTLNWAVEENTSAIALESKCWGITDFGFSLLNWMISRSWSPKCLHPHFRNGPAVYGAE